MYLPQEVLRNIANHLEFAHLLHFSRVNRTWNQIAQPAIYGHLTLKYTNYGRLYLLLRTITNRPERGKLIRRLTLDPWYPFGHNLGNELKFEPAPPEVTTQLVAAVGTLSLTSEMASLLRLGLEQSSTDAGLALLLCLCPAIEYISLEPCHDISDTIVMSVLAAANEETSNFPLPPDIFRSNVGWPLLAKARVENADPESCTRVDEVESLIFLPALRTFQGHGLGLIDPEFDTSLISNIREVFLEHSLLNADGLETLLKACPDLITFSIELGDGCMGEHCDLSWIELGAVLREHGSYLETFMVSSWASYGFFDDLDETMGPLTALTSLRVLRLPYDALFGRSLPPPHAQRLKDILPKNLKSLCLQAQNMDDGIRRLCDKQVREVRDSFGFEGLRIRELIVLPDDYKISLATRFDEVDWAA
ncbi:hypothetical protein K461DRAFT_283139 [Myriangium duriaei CBS 260.36]|uniref:F-box domain-containing protein n=1 Tax=Myriangium duriaei CBS 260.36 TaxID=1168546 RepID=A0A9P4IWJ0_9PEZI|nr:hypothetical protein K461DRAFT_283139 [Myriangium duriaei CBS 260.36]